MQIVFHIHISVFKHSSHIYNTCKIYHFIVKVVPHSIRALDPELILVSRQSARRWLVINPAVGLYYYPLGPRLPFQPKSITALWPLVPNYTAWWQRHVCEQLAQVITWKWNGRQSNMRPLVHASITPPVTTPYIYNAYRYIHTCKWVFLYICYTEKMTVWLRGNVCWVYQCS